MLQLTNSVADDTFESVEAAANIAGQTMRRFAWISDKTKDERQRLHTILPKLWCLDGDDLRISLIDTPGHRSCALMCIASMCMADVALVVVSANRGNFEEGIGVQGSDARAQQAGLQLSIFLSQAAPACSCWLHTRWASRALLWP
jgi:elongation factor 1-alpha